MTFKIEKDVQHPRGYGTNDKRIYPFADMEKGDSFFVPAGTMNRDGKPLTSSGFSNTASNRGKILGMKFSVRSENGGFRCWRVS